MPVCLNCGMAIGPGKKFCDSCIEYGRDVQVKDLVEFAKSSSYVPERHNSRRWLIAALLVLCGMLVLGSYVLIASIPSGLGNKASNCRKNLERVQDAIDAYGKVELKYPVAGTVDEDSELFEKGYLEQIPKCPSTSHFYLLESADGDLKVVCDSGLEGHSLTK